MTIVIDSNILISALIKDSSTRRIIVESGLEFSYPEISLQEISKHKQLILQKGGYTEDKLQKIMNKLLEYINLIPTQIIQPKLTEATTIIGSIDPNDVVFIAAALALNAKIWSEDKDFERQTKITILKTNALINRFETAS